MVENTWNKIMANIMLWFPYLYLVLSMVCEEIIGKICCVILVFCLFYLIMLILRENSYKIILASILLFFILIVCGILFGIEIYSNVDFYGYIFTMLIMLIASDSCFQGDLRKILYKEAGLLVVANYIYIGVVFAYVLFGIGFQSGTHYWQGPLALPHALAYTCLVFYTETILILSAHKVKSIYIYILKLLLVAVILATAVRTAILILAIFVAFELLEQISYLKIMVFVELGVFGLVFVLVNWRMFSNISIVQKTIEAMQGGSITSGREWYIEWAMDYFKKISGLSRFFGTSIENIRDVMFSHVGVAIHAHNDFVNILVGYGALGILAFLLIFYMMCQKTRFIWLPLVISMFMFFNGLIMYLVIIPCIPIIKLCFEKTEIIQEGKG